MSEFLPHRLPGAALELELLERIGSRYQDQSARRVSLGDAALRYSSWSPEPGQGKVLAEATIDLEAGRNNTFSVADSDFKPNLEAALKNLDLKVGKVEDALQLLRSAEDAGKMVLSCSGFASKHESGYAEESVIVAGMLDRLKPDIVYGGTSLGTVGLVGLLTERHAHEQGKKIVSVGFVPLEGLRVVSPTVHTVVLGTHFGDEIEPIGKFGKMHCVIGGGKNTAREYSIALAAGKKVVVFALDKYTYLGDKCFTNTVYDLPETAVALANRQVMIVKSLEEFDQRRAEWGW